MCKEYIPVFSLWGNSVRHLIEIAPATKYEMMHSFIHALTHYYQYRNNILSYDSESYLWNGKPHCKIIEASRLYYRLPWEVQARAYSDKILFTYAWKMFKIKLLKMLGKNK